MLDFLFRRLTEGSRRALRLFESVTRLTREPHWYIEGHVPDTLDGRFAVLATVTALVLVRLERSGDSGNRISVLLTERFIEVMESEHRELGLGDPSLGKKVRMLVGSLARRTELWRNALDGQADWPAATRASLYTSGSFADALAHSAAALERLWNRLLAADLDSIEQGQLE